MSSYVSRCSTPQAKDEFLDPSSISPTASTSSFFFFTDSTSAPLILAELFRSLTIIIQWERGEGKKKRGSFGIEARYWRCTVLSFLRSRELANGIQNRNFLIVSDEDALYFTASGNRGGVSNRMLEERHYATGCFVSPTNFPFEANDVREIASAPSRRPESPTSRKREQRVLLNQPNNMSDR